MHAVGGNAANRGSGSRWLSPRSLKASSALRLFCLPYAGGSNLTFRGWENALPAGVDVCAIQLPGRGARLHEPLFTRLEPLVRALGDELRPFLDRPFAFFGHSMGALVAFELARHLRATHGLEPAVLFVSADRAPDVPDGRKDYLLPEDQFVAMLRRLNGTPAEILDNPEALHLLLPILRADYETVQTYEYLPGPPLSSRIRAFSGTRDAGTPQETVAAWGRHTSGSFSLSLLPGGHFFIEEARAQLLTIVAHELRRVLDRTQLTG